MLLANNDWHRLALMSLQQGFVELAWFSNQDLMYAQAEILFLNPEP